MRRGAVLSFPAPRGLRDAERDSLQRFVAAVPGAQADILIDRDRREVAILTLAGRHVWLTRDDTGIGARDACSGQLLAEDTCIVPLLAKVQAALLPGRAAWSGMADVTHSVQCRPA